MLPALRWDVGGVATQWRRTEHWNEEKVGHRKGQVKHSTPQLTARVRPSCSMRLKDRKGGGGGNIDKAEAF